MKPILFVLAVVLSTAGFGVALDLVTAHIAVEYFTVDHPHVVNSDSPVVMALVWGVGASWWFGLIAGVVICWFNARRPCPMSLSEIFPWIPKALVVVGLVMMTVLASIYALGGMVPERLRRPMFEHDRRLMAVAVAHSTEYVLGGVAVVVVLRKIAQRTGVRNS